MPQRYKFPLNETDYYSGTVTFQVLKEIPPTIATRRPNVDIPKEEEDNMDLTALAGVLSEVTDVSLTTSKTINGDAATLYLPQAIQFNDGVAYEDFDLGRIGAVAEAAVQQGASLGSVMKSSVEQSISALTELFNQTLTPDAARLAATRVSKIGGERIAAGVKSALQVTSNPNKRVLFREVNIREFSFAFKLIPTSRREANMIESLIKFFRTELYPEDSIRIDTNVGSLPIGYKFPNKFEITFKHKKKNIAHKILPSYLVSMQTVYNPTGMGMFEDGHFSEVEIVMNFRESRALTKDDIRNKGY